MKRMCGILNCLSRWSIISALTLGVMTIFCTSMWAHSHGNQAVTQVVRAPTSRDGSILGRWEVVNDETNTWTNIRNEQRTPHDRVARAKKRQTSQTLSPEQKARLKKKYREWESLSPEERRELRRRMERYKELPPEDRQLLDRRYKQWQELSPEEQRKIKRNLELWDQLTPQQQEEIRKRFRMP